MSVWYDIYDMLDMIHIIMDDLVTTVMTDVILGLVKLYIFTRMHLDINNTLFWYVVLSR